MWVPVFDRYQSSQSVQFSFQLKIFYCHNVYKDIHSKLYNGKHSDQHSFNGTNDLSTYYDKGSKKFFWFCGPQHYGVQDQSDIDPLKLITWDIPFALNLQYEITVSRGHHDISNHQHLDYLFDNLFRQSKLSITGPF